MKTYTNKNAIFTPKLNHILTLNIEIMASRRQLKKQISYIASDLFLASLVEGVNREAVVGAIHNILALIPRISHTQPGNVKGYYKKLREDLNKEIQVVADELNK
jgi:hypothetical protein